MKDFTYLEKKIKELKKAQKLNNENISDLSDSDSDSDSDISSKISFLKNKHILKKFNKYFTNKSHHNNNYKYKIIIVLILLFILNSSKLKNNNISSFVSNIFNNFLSSNNINQSDESNESNESNKSSGSNFINFFSNFMQKNNNILNEDSNEIQKIKKSNNNIQKIFENNHKITMNHINILSSKLENNDNNFELINNKINEIQKNIYNIDDDMKNLQTNLYSKQFKNNILSKKKNHKPNLFLEPKEFNKNHHKHKSNFYSSSDSSSFSSDSSSESSSSSCSSIDINLINQKIIKNNNNIKDYIPQSVFLKNYENLEVSDSNNKLTFNFKIGSSYYNHFKLYSIFNQEFFGLIKIKFYLIDDPNYFFIYTYNQNNSIYSSINQFGFIIENNYLNISSLSNVNVLNCDFNKENYINNPILNLNQYENNNSTNTYYEVVCEIDFLPNPDKNIDTNPSNKLDSTLIFNKEGLNADYFSTFNFNILKFKFEVIQTKKPEMQSLKPLNIEISHDSNKSPLIIKNQIKSIFNIGEYDDKEYWNTIMEKTHQINRSIQFVENVTSGYQTVHFK